MLDSHLIAKTRPLADRANIVYWKNYRVTVLGDRLFRLEQSEEKKFRDAATQSVWFRDVPPQAFETEISEEKAVIRTALCTLILKENRADCRIVEGGRAKKISNAGNLKGTYRTLDCCEGEYHMDPWEHKRLNKVELGTGVCSRTGVAVLDDASSLTLGADGEVKAEKGSGTDEYIFAYGKDHRAAVQALYSIAGEVPMVPRYALGNWWSRYREYSDREYLQLLNRFEEREIPLTVATIDMDWHYSTHLDEQMGITAKGRNTDFYGGNGGWTGYTWNKDLFPDHRALLKEIEGKNLKITLNLHPADGVRWWEDCYEKMANSMGRDATMGEKIPFDISDNKFINYYFSIIHKPYEEEGVTFWWIDWQQGTSSNLAGLDPLWALNHYHYLDHAKNHATPLILSRYAGVGSHRYPLGFSGDTAIEWATLRYLPYFTATASNIGYTWWSHDIGGHHFGQMNGELYVRHLQFGVFSPVTRLHCTNWETLTKEPWTYGNGAGAIAEKWLKLRHSLIPFLYSCDYRTHKEGLALIEPLYYQWQSEQAAYEMKDEYLFGGLLVAPVVTPRQKDGYARTKVWLPEGTWTDIFTGDVYTAPKGGAKKTLLRMLDNIPVLAKAGTILPLSKDKGNSVKNPESLEIRVYKGDGNFELYEDGKETGTEGEFFTRFESSYIQTSEAGLQSLQISSRGDGRVLPKNRTLSLKFSDIPEGEISLFIDGKKREAHEKICDEVTLELPFEAGKTYRVEVRFALKDELDEIKARALETMIRIEGDNKQKFLAWNEMKQAKTKEEFVAALDRSAISEGGKQRLKESL
jgi:alpha-glucosidase (family GH31 glycosyl hydrolase)